MSITLLIALWSEMMFKTGQNGLDESAGRPDKQFLSCTRGLTNTLVNCLEMFLVEFFWLTGN